MVHFNDLFMTPPAIGMLHFQIQLVELLLRMAQKFRSTNAAISSSSTRSMDILFNVLNPILSR